MNKNVIIGIVVALVIVIGVYALFTQYAPNDAAPSPDRNMAEGEGMMASDDAMMPDLAGEDVEYMPGVLGYLALPETPGQHPGLILIHEWWGLNDDIKSIADRYAAQGYAALAVDLYGGESTIDPARARELSSAVREDVDPAFDNLRAAVTYLKGQAKVDGDLLASVGWCFGGGWSYQMAVNDLGVDASVMYYGQFDPADDFEMMKAGILGHFGEDDAAIAVDDVREFQAALSTANGKHEVYIYPNVGHGFANVRGGDNLAYSEEASKEAWQRTISFLSQVFSSASSMESGAMMEEDLGEDDPLPETPEGEIEDISGDEPPAPDDGQAVQ